LEIETRLAWFIRRLDPYSRGLVFSVAFFFGCLGIGRILYTTWGPAFLSSIFLDSLTLLIAMAAYSHQARSLIDTLEDAKERGLFTIADTKVRYPSQNGSKPTIAAWGVVTKLFWTLIVQCFPSFAYVKRNRNIVDRRWAITAVFTIIAVSIWIFILVACAHKSGPGKEGPLVWLGYSLYLALITIWAIPVAMLPPDGFTGIAEQCWFVFRSHIVYDIPMFYASVAFSYSLFSSSAQPGGIGWSALFQGLELSFVVFFMGVLAVTLLDTSITVWTILNSGQLNGLELMTIDSHGGLGSFYSLNNWNTTLLGIVAIVQASKLVVGVLVTPGASLTQTAVYTIPAIIGVPLLMTLTWGVSVFYLHKRIVSLKESMIARITREGLLQGYQSEGLLATRDRLVRISSWPKAGSFIATALSIIATGLSFAYPYIIKPLLAALGIPS
jgi:hypothetical protein